MKKLLLLPALLILTLFNANAQAVQWAMTQDVWPANAWGGATPPILTSDGTDLISAGSIQTSITFGAQTFAGSNGNNGYLVKHSPAGNVIWASHLVGAYSQAITTDASGNIFLTGVYGSSLSIGSLLLTNADPSAKFFIAKFSPSGALLWARSSNTPIENNNYKITTDGSGNVYVAGSFLTPFSISTASVTTQAGNDVFLLKYDTNGNLQWLKNFGTPGSDRVFGLIGGIQNEVYLAYTSWIGGIPTPPMSNGFYLKKFNQAGVQQWSKFVNSAGFVTNVPSGDESVYLTRDASENIYVAGSKYSAMTFDNILLSHNNPIPNPNTLEIFLAKLSPSGTWKWAKHVQANKTNPYLVGMAAEKKDELNLITYTQGNLPLPTNFNILKCDTAGLLLKSNTFSTGVPPNTPLSNFYGVTNTVTDNFSNNYFSGGLFGNNTIGNIPLVAGPPIPDRWSINPSATYIARLLNSANTIAGTLFIDLNGNGLKDTGEKTIPNAIIALTPDQKYYSTDTSGAYQFSLPAGTYNLQVLQPASHYTISPAIHSVTFTGQGQAQTKDFALAPIPNRNDVKVTVTNLTPARPGFALKYRITYQNIGTTTLSDSVSLNYPSGSLTFTSASMAPATQQTGKLQWFYQALQPHETRNIDVDFMVAAATPLNTRLQTITAIKPLAADFYLENNTDTLALTVTGSLDPNDKQVSHATLTPNQVANGILLDYTIRFQNTGTDTAFTVIIRDSIDSKLQMPTFELLSASHPYTFRFLDTGMAEWRFDNILLPDSAHNEAASHGYIRYRMRSKNNLVIGDEIKSRAAILFDYNAPVNTNYAVTRVGNLLGIKETPGDLPAFRLYPNPASNFVTVEADLSGTAEISLVNTVGQPVKTVSLPTGNQIRYELPLENLPKGIYLVKLQTESGMQTKRLVIQ